MDTRTEADLLEICTNALYDYYETADEIVTRGILEREQVKILCDVIFDIYCQDKDRENGEIL